MTDDELARKPIAEIDKIREGLPPDNPEALQIDRLYARIARNEQHTLDLKLIERQVRWMKFAAIIGVIATIAGAILGALLTTLIPTCQRQAPLQKSISQPQQNTASPTLLFPLSTGAESSSGSSSDAPKRK